MTVWTETEVGQVIIEGKEAVGVAGNRYVIENGTTKLASEFRVVGNVEIIISAGALSSPQLLMLRYVAMDSLWEEVMY